MLTQKTPLKIESKPNQTTPHKKNHILIFFFSGLIHTVLLFFAYCLVSSYAKIEKIDLILSTELISNELNSEDLLKKPFFIKDKKDKEETENIPITIVEEVESPENKRKNSDKIFLNNTNSILSNESLIGSSLMGHISETESTKKPFSNRFGVAKKKALLKRGGSKQTELAVESALDWLKRQQETDGHWDKIKYGAEMDNNGFERRKLETNSVLTALATLAFISAGCTPSVGKYQETVKKSVTWILSKQLANGSFGESFEFSVYNNSLCSIILSELTAMHPELDYGPPAQKAINYLVNLKKVHEGFSNYSNIPCSTSVNGWLLMALKSAKMANLKIPSNIYEKIEKQLREVTTKDKSGAFQFVNYMEENDRQKRKGTMTAVGLLMYEYLGFKRSELNGLSETLIKELPVYGKKSITQELYRWYNTTLALHQYGGTHWRTWNAAMSTLLLKHQRQDGPKDGTLNDLHGSWDFEQDHFGQNLGRIYTTAMATLCLEVYYRYDSLYNSN